ncbi:pilus assembly protein [Massilia agilis]|uniref:Pilus assembly protein n=1 Tax=Massilia agilis TaxID=1811226 RepID=A0ABT2DCT6_9BURK|nr:TadE family protein [Massilia agilis]MCS0809127.1 pilus assembly protein [Massilia agilis]
MSVLERPPVATRRRQQGTAAVELAFIMIPFLLFIFGVMELARAMYVINTLQEVTRRAAVGAANSDFHEPALTLVRQRAIFRNSAGSLLLAPPVTDQHVRIDYLALIRNPDGSTTPKVIPTASLPETPAKNLATCTADANAPTCIRLVRARICDPVNSSGCDAVTAESVFPLVKLPLPMPLSTTIVPAQSLGYTTPACLPCGV